MCHFMPIIQIEWIKIKFLVEMSRLSFETSGLVKDSNEDNRSSYQLNFRMEFFPEIHKNRLCCVLFKLKELLNIFINIKRLENGILKNTKLKYKKEKR